MHYSDSKTSKHKKLIKTIIAAAARIIAEVF